MIMPTRRPLAAAGLALVLLALLSPLAACGRKGPPVPPADQPVTYPRTYPRD
jgi:predicted small lipoprotein YifL